MSQSRRKRTEDSAVMKTPSSKAIDRDRKGRWTGFIIASVVIALILIIVGVSYYQNSVAPFRLTIITVDDTIIRMDYFLKRTRLAGINSISMLEALTDEQLIKIGAPQFVGEVSPEDIDQALRTIARGEGETISESEFKEWYRQQLNETELSDSEYKEITTTNIMAARLYEYLAQRMSTVAEQVHLHVMLLETQKVAEQIRVRLEAGEDFADLARELSLDATSRENGGDLGWLPRGVIDYQLENEAFNLSPGDVSEPLVYYDTSDPSVVEVVGYYLLMTSERADAREVDEDYLSVLAAKAFDDWLLAEISLHDVNYHGLNNGFDSETDYWIKYQLAKR